MGAVVPEDLWFDDVRGGATGGPRLSVIVGESAEFMGNAALSDVLEFIGAAATWEVPVVGV